MLGEYRGQGKGEINFGNNAENKINYILNSEQIQSSWEHPNMMVGRRGQKCSQTHRMTKGMM